MRYESWGEYLLLNGWFRGCLCCDWLPKGHLIFLRLLSPPAPPPWGWIHRFSDIPEFIKALIQHLCTAVKPGTLRKWRLLWWRSLSKPVISRAVESWVNLEGEETQQARLTSWYDDIRLQRFDMALTPLQKMAAFILFICALLLLRDCGQDEVQWCFLWSESVWNHSSQAYKVNVETAFIVCREQNYSHVCICVSVSCSALSERIPMNLGALKLVGTSHSQI